MYDNNQGYRPNNDDNNHNYPIFQNTYLPPDNDDYSTGPERPHRRRNKAGSVVAGVLAISLISGAAGGGATWWIMSSQQQDVVAETAVQVENKANTDISAVQTIEQSESAAPITRMAGGTGDIAEIVSKVSDSVVEINVEIRSSNFFYGDYVAPGSGSGVVLREDGYIVTNQHVVEGAETIKVRLSDGEECDATLVASDMQTDLAVLKIDKTGLKPVEMADSDNLAVGEMAVVIGNPLGTLGGTVTDGIISAKNREITFDNGVTMNLIQTSAAVNPGNSGGGLFNSEGKLLGIVNAKSGGSNVEGLGFAIPSNTVATVTDDIIEKGYVAGRPEIGIRVLAITDTQTAFMYRVNEMGIYVLSATRDNGLQSGDLLVSIDGEEITEGSDVSSIIQQHNVGDTIDVVIKRDGNKQTISVTLTEQVPEYVKELDL